MTGASSGSGGEEDLLHHLAQGMSQRDMRFLDPGGQRGGDNEGDLDEVLHPSARSSAESDGPDTDFPGLFQRQQDIF